MHKSQITLYNSLSKKIEEFSPIITGKVGMYHCGPTVYDDVHIGNLRAFLLADLLRRIFEWNRYDVTQVINITDIGHLTDDGDQGEDKMTKALRRDKKPITLDSMLKLATYYQDRFIEDLENMRIKLPHQMPRASEHIEDDINIIKKLEKAGYVYRTSKSVYFDTEKFPDYGVLGLPPLNNSESRTGVDSDKKNPRDFALWKIDEKLGWSSPWGQGFPGWHIECSGMSIKYLGDHFDIHTGGIDLLPTHHNNEVAQSVCSNGAPFVNYWLHNEHLSINKDKMSKSSGNFYTLRSLSDLGFHPLDYRYWLLQSNYRTKVDFTMESLQGAKTARLRLQKHITDVDVDSVVLEDSEYLQNFTEAINKDIGTPEALRLAWEAAKDKKLSPELRSALLLRFDEVLGIFGETTKIADDIPEIVLELVSEREIARANNNWDEADTLRTEIMNHGYTVKDTNAGSEILPI